MVHPCDLMPLFVFETSKFDIGDIERTKWDKRSRKRLGQRRIYRSTLSRSAMVLVASAAATHAFPFPAQTDTSQCSSDNGSRVAPSNWRTSFRDWRAV